MQPQKNHVRQEVVQISIVKLQLGKKIKNKCHLKIPFLITHIRTNDIAYISNPMISLLFGQATLYVCGVYFLINLGTDRQEV